MTSKPKVVETYDPKTAVRTVEVWVDGALVETDKTCDRVIVVTGRINDQ